MTLGTDAYGASFELIGERNIGGTVLIEGRSIIIRPSTGGTIRRLLATATLAVLGAETVDYRTGATGAIVGGLLAGPIGVIAGASTGRLLRECHFTITFPDGLSFICKALFKLFELFDTHHRLVVAQKQNSKSIDAVLSKFPVPDVPASIDEVALKSNVAIATVHRRNPMDFLVAKIKK